MDSVCSCTVLIYRARHISQFAHISQDRSGYLEGGQTNRKSDNLCSIRYTARRERDFVFDNKPNPAAGIELITNNWLR